MKSEVDIVEKDMPVNFCGAQLNNGKTCMRPVEPGRARCSRHGGAAGAGGVKGPRNGRYVDGFHSASKEDERQWVRRQLSVSERSDGRALAPAPSTEHLEASVATVKANYRVAKPPGDVDPETWMGRLQEVLGHGSKAFVTTLLNQLVDAAAINRDYVTTDESLSAALELIRGLAPSNTAEAALAVHVAQLHMAAAALNGRIALYGFDRSTNEAARSAARLERAFLAAFEIYHRLKYGNRQVIRIERVVEVERNQQREELP